MNGITLQNNGDSIEIRYHSLFLANEFPSYERFWLHFVVPMTNRPENIHLKSDQELAAIGRGDHDLCVSQLHYSVVSHLARAFDIKTLRPLNINGLIEGMVRLVGAQDVAFELLGRYLNPGTYDPWLSAGKKGFKGSREARRFWQDKEKYPLQDIRNYRNHLVHGRIIPSIINEDCYVPRIGVEDNYFDWRLITNNPNIGKLIGVDFFRSNEVLEDAWVQTINYIEMNWRNYLG